MRMVRWSASVIILLAAVTCFGETARAQSQLDPQAMATLQKMARYLADAQRFSVTIRDGYDVVQESGQKIEFGEIRKVNLSRPDRLRVDVEKSNGSTGSVYFDGKNISIHLASDDTYAVASREGSLDAAIKYTVGELGVTMPLAMMFLSTLPTELEGRILSAAVVESTMITGAVCDHLAVRTAQGVDFQVWVAQGDTPLPRRIVITYIKEAGQPQFWADLSNWNLNPTFSDALFTFTPPSGAEKIQFLSEVAKSVPQTAAPRKGGRK